MKKLDCVGLQCPMPGVNTSKALKNLEPGEILEVTTDHKAGRSDVPRMAKRLGFEVISSEEKDDLFVYRIKKA
jgi:tRNA 2-thiouridine synthesizing protein A